MLLPSCERPLMHFAYKFRIYPNRKQEAALNEMLEAFADLYNAALQQRIEAYRRRRISVGFYQQASEVKSVREADERLKRYSYSAEEQVLRRLDKAFSGFFRRVKAKQTAGFPRFRAKSRFNSADFKFGDGLTIKTSGRLRIKGVENDIKVRWHRAIPPYVRVATSILSRSCGKWFVCFQTKTPQPDISESAFRPVGLDLGVSNFVALSTGDLVLAPKCAKKAAKDLRRAQRSVSRKTKQSRRQRVAKQRVARLHAKIANQRRDSSHKLSRQLVDRFTHIAIEKLNIAALARGMLAKLVSDAAWKQFIQQISYKAAWAGGVVMLVDPRGTSQTCPECGNVASKALDQRTHRCDCGCVLDRDVAAARVVLQRAKFGPGTGLQGQSEPVAA